MKIDARQLLLVTFFLSISILATWLDHVERHFYGVKAGVTLDGESLQGLLASEVRDVIRDRALEYQRTPREPELDRGSGQIIPEQAGCLVDVEANLQRVMSAAENENVKIQTVVVPSRYTSQDLEIARETIGYYETWFHGSNQRYTNISLALRSINNSLLWPGQQFSFNDVVGPRTPERGYMPAPVILRGAGAMDFGGGVCQASSTLYNAALAAKLTIIERHGHSKAIHYVPAGRDATVTYNYLDLKLKNNRDGPVIIYAGMSGNKIWIKITGRVP